MPIFSIDDAYQTPAHRARLAKRTAKGGPVVPPTAQGLPITTREIKNIIEFRSGQLAAQESRADAAAFLREIADDLDPPAAMIDATLAEAAPGEVA